MNIESSEPVFFITAGESFLNSLASGMIERLGIESYYKALVLLPSQNSVNGLYRVFNQRGIKPPRIRAIADAGSDSDSILEMSEIERRLFLAKIIYNQYSKDGNSKKISHDSALKMASHFGYLIDEMQKEDISFERLRDIPIDNLASHWQQNIDSIIEIKKNWDAYISKSGKIEKVSALNNALKQLANSLKNQPPNYPIIIAGSTASLKSTRELMSAVINLKIGMVVLPFFCANSANEVEVEKPLEACHPQATMFEFLRANEINPNGIENWHISEKDGCQIDRKIIASEIMRIPDEIYLWKNLEHKTIDTDISIIESPNIFIEARVAALIAKENLELGKNVSFITTEKSLIQAFINELERFDIKYKNLFASSYAKTKIGEFMILLADWLTDRDNPVKFLSFLRQPVLKIIEDEHEQKKAIQDIDILLLRGIRIEGGIDGLLHYLDNLNNSHKPIENLDEKKARVRNILTELKLKTESSYSTFSSYGVDISKGFKEILNIANLLCSNNLLQNDEKFYEALQEVIAATKNIERMNLVNFAAVVQDVLSTFKILPEFEFSQNLDQQERNAYVSIMTPMDARLLDFDVSILAGLNEGCFPESIRYDPILNHAIKKEIGLISDEKNVALSAHDFINRLSDKKLYLTRAKKIDGNLATRSRFLSRFVAFFKNACGKNDWYSKVKEEEENYLKKAYALDKPDFYKKLPEPMPKPPVSARPNKLSVTSIEKLFDNPYAIYASKILNIEPLEDIDKKPDASDFGIVVHKILSEYNESYGELINLPHIEKVRYINELANSFFKKYEKQKSLSYFWAKRFEKIAEWFVERDSERRKANPIICSEIYAEMPIVINGIDFTLTAIADRVEFYKDGMVALIDYKTGSIPTKSEIDSGVRLQLPLTAAMIEHGAFSKYSRTTKNNVDEISFWHIKGTSEAAIEKSYDNSNKAISEAGYEIFIRIMNEFMKPETPYLVFPNLKSDKPRYDDYFHLARLDEWRR